VKEESLLALIFLIYPAEDFRRRSLLFLSAAPGTLKRFWVAVADEKHITFNAVPHD
jgi:hypothetical protein